MNELPNKALLRVDEVADFFGVTKKTIYNWINDGVLPANKINGVIRIPREIVKSLMDESVYDPGA